MKRGVTHSMTGTGTGTTTGFGSVPRGYVDDLGYLHTHAPRPPHASTLTVTVASRNRS